MTVAIVVPVTLSNEWRERAWAYVCDHYRTNHPAWDIVVGSAQPWSKGEAIANALQSTTADRLVLADADSFVDPGRLEVAVALLETNPWVVPQSRVRRLTQKATERLYEGAETSGDLPLDRVQYAATPGGGIVVITRDAYNAVRGIDPRFVGWGGEDEAFGWALESLVAKPKVLPGVLWHLWHPRIDNRWTREGRQLRRTYNNARRSPRLMRQLIDQR